MNEYELTFCLKGVAGIQKDRSAAASEQTARDLLRAKYGREQVQVISGQQTSFGGGRDDRRDDQQRRR